MPAIATTPADLDEFHNFALEQVSRGDSVSVMQLAKRWTEERDREDTIRELRLALEEAEQGLTYTAAEVIAGVRAEIAAVRASQAKTDALP